MTEKRLIDAASLKEAFENEWHLTEYIDYMVDQAPTIDAAPVVHGRWEKSDIPHEKYCCSACGGACWYYDYEGEVARSRYCPNCGAKMDKTNPE